MRMRWAIELWNIYGGGYDEFRTKKEALREYYRLKRKIKADFPKPEYVWKETKDGSEITFYSEEEDLLLMLSDTRNFMD